MHYAGFWVRVLAYLIDFVILLVVQSVINLFFGVSVFGAEAPSALGASNAIGLIIGIAYFAGFEASDKQATPGKMALGLIVTDTDGGRISFLRAIGRYFAKILSGLILFIGYIMVAFTDRKQGLHDLLASTLVVKGEPGTVGVDAAVFE